MGCMLLLMSLCAHLWSGALYTRPNTTGALGDQRTAPARLEMPRAMRRRDRGAGDHNAVTVTSTSVTSRHIPQHSLEFLYIASDTVMNAQ